MQRRKVQATPIERVVRPFSQFFEREASGGLLLILASTIAILVANSGASGSYFGWINQEATVSIGSLKETNHILGWINDGLMALFFLVVGLEIKRELLTGELSSFKQAVVPMAAAFGGMIVPALIYLGFNSSGANREGWAIPMATDIAFAIGILTLLGNRVPFALKVFLAALAIVDDIGAVVVIALFYSKGIDGNLLGMAFGTMAIMALGNWAGIRNLLFYMLSGLVLWVFIHHSGLHGTLAGVITAFMIPAKSRLDAREFASNAKVNLRALEVVEPGTRMLSEEHEAQLYSIERSIEKVTTPLQRLLRHSHAPVAFLIVPLFAFANAGIVLSSELGRNLVDSRESWGILAGLIIGKPLGIVLMTWMAVKSKIGSLPTGINFRHILGAGCLGGIGFTMSIFIASLAFPNQELLQTAKAAIFVSSIVSGLLGALILTLRTPKKA